MSGLSSDQLQLVQEAYPVSLDVFEGRWICCCI